MRVEGLVEKIRDGKIQKESHLEWSMSQDGERLVKLAYQIQHDINENKYASPLLDCLATLEHIVLKEDVVHPDIRKLCAYQLHQSLARQTGERSDFFRRLYCHWLTTKDFVAEHFPMITVIIIAIVVVIFGLGFFFLAMENSING